jgi:hypothetical protein
MFSPSYRRGTRLRAAALSLAAAGLLAGSAASVADAAPGDPDLSVSSPTNVQFGYFDDHSVVGDAHPHWDVGAGDPKWTNLTEPFLLTFTTNVTSAGADLSICGTKVPTDANVGNQWMRVYQAAPGTACGTSSPAVGWSKYVVSNHLQQNRWQVMDFERFALVPAGGVPSRPLMPAAVTGPGAANDPLRSQAFYPGCPTLFTQPLPGTTSPQLHCWDPPGGANVAARPGGGTAPAITAANGAYWDTRWGSCVGPFAGESGPDSGWCGKNQDGLAGFQAGISANTSRPIEQNYYSEPTTQVIAFDAARDIPNITTGTYYLVAIVNPYGAFRESNNANNISCTAIRITTTPGRTDGIPFTVQQLPTAQQPAQCPWSSVPNTAAAPSTVPGTRGSGGTVRRLPSITRARARSWAKSALRKAFGRRLTRVSYTCKLRSRTTSTCSVRFRKSGAAYRGSVRLRTTRVGVAGVWRYSVDVRRTKGGKTTRIRRGYRTGGTIRLR